MSRDEARKQLAGSFKFELRGGSVVVRDESLLEEIRLMTGEVTAYQVPHTQAATGISATTGRFSASA